MKIDIKRIVPEPSFQPFEMRLVFESDHEAMLFRHLIGCHGGTCIEEKNVKGLKEELGQKMVNAGFSTC